MIHQEIANFVIDVFEAKIYKTNILAGVAVVRDSTGWTLSYTPDYWNDRGSKGFNVKAAVFNQAHQKGAM